MVNRRVQLTSHALSARALAAAVILANTSGPLAVTGATRAHELAPLVGCRAEAVLPLLMNELARRSSHREPATLAGEAAARVYDQLNAGMLTVLQRDWAARNMRRTVGAPAVGEELLKAVPVRPGVTTQQLVNKACSRAASRVAFAN